MKKNETPLLWLIVILTLLAALTVTVLAVNFKVKNNQGAALLEGTLEADEVDVSPKVAGRIGRTLVQEGSKVKAGELLAVMDSPEIEAKVKQARSMYQAALARANQAELAIGLQDKVLHDQIAQAQAGYQASLDKYQMARNGARSQEITQAKAGMDAAQAAYRTADNTYKRFKGLYQEGVIPKQQEEEIELKYLSAKAGLKAAQARYDMAREGARPEEIAQAKDGVDASRAALSMAQNSLTKVPIQEKEAQAARQAAQAARGQLEEALAYQAETRLKAPISGYISQQMVDAGELVSPGLPVFTIVKNRDFKVKVYADESLFGYLKLDDPVKVSFPALAGRELAGRIVRISQAAEFATHKATNERGSFDMRAMEVVVKIVEPSPELRTGMDARVLIPRRKAR